MYFLDEFIIPWATPFSIFLTIIIFLLQRRKEEKSYLTFQNSLINYFESQLESYFNFVNRQYIYIENTTKNIDKDFISQCSLKVESNKNYENIISIDSPELYKALESRNRKNEFSKNYKYLMHGVGLLTDTIENIKYTYKEYLKTHIQIYNNIKVLESELRLLIQHNQSNKSLNELNNLYKSVSYHNYNILKLHIKEPNKLTEFPLEIISLIYKCKLTYDSLIENAESTVDFFNKNLVNIKDHKNQTQQYIDNINFKPQSP